MRRFGVLFLAKEPALTSAQLDKLSDIFITIGQLAMGFMVLPFIIPGLDRDRTLVIIFGLVSAIGCWVISVLIVRKLE